MKKRIINFTYNSNTLRQIMKAMPIITPSTYDVVFEKGLSFQNHPGNVHYRKVIKEKAADYNLAETRMEKDMIAHWALQQIHGKFLIRTKDDKVGLYIFTVVSKEKVISKIKQALRDRRKQQPNIEDFSSKASTKAISMTKENLKRNGRRDERRDESHTEARKSKYMSKNTFSSTGRLDPDMKKLIDICKNLI